MVNLVIRPSVSPGFVPCTHSHVEVASCSRGLACCCVCRMRTSSKTARALADFCPGRSSRDITFRKAYLSMCGVQGSACCTVSSACIVTTRYQLCCIDSRLHWGSFHSGQCLGHRYAGPHVLADGLTLDMRHRTGSTTKQIWGSNQRGEATSSCNDSLCDFFEQGKASVAGRLDPNAASKLQRKTSAHGRHSCVSIHSSSRQCGMTMKRCMLISDHYP